MASSSGEDKSSDLYAVLGLKKECSPAELRGAYKKLALRWHPDRCSASGNSKFVEEAKKKFQAIQEAYTVLSDTDKRFLYDVGAYDSDDDENGMGDFLGEMAMMMSQTEPSSNVQESFEELQDLFKEMCQRDVSGFASSSQGANLRYHKSSNFSSSIATTCSSNNNNNNNNNKNKRNFADMNSGKGKSEDRMPSDFSSFGPYGQRF